jgi:hypothetical protein
MLGRRVSTHLLVRVHAGKATRVAGLATFLGSRLDFLLGPSHGSASLRDSTLVGGRGNGNLPICKVSWIRVGHVD